MRPRSPDAFRCCAQQYIASDSARLARDRFDCELKPSDNDNRRRCCYSGRRHRIIAPRNRAVSRNHISRSLIVPALQPAQPAQISLSAEEMEARWDLEPPLRAAVSRSLAPPEFRWVLAKPFCAATAIFRRRFSFFSFLLATLLSLETSSLSALAWPPAFRSESAKLRVLPPAFSVLSPLVSATATAKTLSFSCARKFLVSGSAIPPAMVNSRREPSEFASVSPGRFVAPEGQSRQWPR